MEQFCYWHIKAKEDTGDTWTCTAHLAEAHVFKCPYETMEEAEKGGCCDRRRIEEARAQEERVGKHKERSVIDDYVKSREMLMTLFNPECKDLCVSIEEREWETSKDDGRPVLLSSGEPAFPATIYETCESTYFTMIVIRSIRTGTYHGLIFDNSKRLHSNGNKVD